MRNILAVISFILAAVIISPSIRASWWNAMPHKWHHPPLVMEIGALDIADATGGALIEDASARGGRALELQPGGEIYLSFAGERSHYRLIGVIRVDGAPEAPSSEPLPPVFARLTVEDPAGESRFWRVRLGYRGVYTDSLDIYFPAYRDGDYRLTLRLDEDSASSILINWLEIRDLFGDCARMPVKSARRLISDDRVALMRAESAARGAAIPRERGLKRFVDMNAEERAELFDSIWASLPPRNALVAPGTRPPMNMTAWYEPWGFLDENRELVYTVDNYRAGEKIGEDNPDDGWGYLNEEDGAESWIAAANQQRWTQAISRVDRLSNTYLQTGDEEAGWHAAMLLAAMADKWPDLDAEVHSARIFTGRGRFSHTWRPGKLGHNFWDTGHCETLNISYDRLFPLIQGNNELASMLGRHIPWIETPDDVIEYFDVQLVQHTLDLLERGVVGSSGRIPQAKMRCAIILAPGEISDRIMEGVFTHLKSDLNSFYGGVSQQLWCNYNRDGSTHTSGAGYAKGQAESLFEIADLTRKYAGVGGDERFNLMDTDRYPFIGSALYFPIIYRVAGGFVPGLGDWGRPWRPREFVYDRNDDGPAFRAMYSAGYELTGDPVFAHMLVEGYGRLDEDDETWARMVEDAEKQPRHPLLSLEPRVFPGYGLAVLEDGVRHDDFRKKTAALLRVGYGFGHGHADTLNLDIYAKGARVAPDLGSRRGVPNPRASRTHCLVEIDGRSFGAIEVSGSATSGTGWATAFHPAPGVQYAAGAGRSEVHPHVSRYERQVALIGVNDDGDAYIFDVFRTRGGSMHTWAFHGNGICEGGSFDVNAPMREAESAEAGRYLVGQNPAEGVAPDPVVAEWRMGERWHRGMVGADYHEGKDPPIMRARLFGHEGALIMTEDADPEQEFYGARIRFFYAQRRAEEGDELSSVWPAVYEAEQGEAPILEARRIILGEGDADDSPVAMYVIAGENGRIDRLFADAAGGEARNIEGIDMSGEFAFWSEDADGEPLKIMMVGGSEIGRDGWRIRAELPEYRAEINDIDYSALNLTLETEWPGALSGEHVAVRRRGPNHISYQLGDVDGREVAFVGSPRMYQSYIERIDEDGGVVTEIDPPLLRADSRFYDGMRVGGPDGDAPWRVREIIAENRSMYLGWPHFNRWKQRISWDDLPDANGDGLRSLYLVHGEERRLRLDVTYISPDGFSFDFVMPEEEPYRTGGWPYVLRRLVNEDGTREWHGLYPGFRYQIYLEGENPPTVDALAGPNGRPELNFYDMGVGDEMVIASRICLSRRAEGLYELRANCGVEIDMPAGAPIYIREIGGEWRRAAFNAEDETLAMPVEEMAGRAIQIAVGDEARDAAPAEAEEF